MNFDIMSTADLLSAMPRDNEDNRWEIKSGLILTKANRHELKRELGKQVSAFANSGGGFLVLGVSKEGAIETCEQSVGRQPMREYLSQLVEQCVEYPVRQFKVYRIPDLESSNKNGVFVVSIDDSVSAPHQAKDERQYYYRIDGHSMPAPHFHLELLRSRTTKAVISIDDLEYVIQVPSIVDKSLLELNVAFRFRVRNASNQIAGPWGLRLGSPNSHWSMKVRNEYKELPDDPCLYGEQETLLPSETTELVAIVRGLCQLKSMRPAYDVEQFWLAAEFDVQALSHNFVSEPVRVRSGSMRDWDEGAARFAFVRQFDRFDVFGKGHSG